MMLLHTGNVNPQIFVVVGRAFLFVVVVVVVVIDVANLKNYFPFM